MSHRLLSSHTERRDVATGPPLAPRWAYWTGGLVATVMRVPYAIEGPKFLLDDYYTLWFRMTGGLLGTPGPGQLAARPGAWLAYLVEFGVIGRHPLPGYLVLAALGVVAAVLLFRCLARLVPWQPALAVSVLWSATANHSSLDHWLSTVNIALGLCLLLGGANSLITSARSARPLLPAVALLVASGLCYEATLPVAVVAVVVIPRLAGRWPRAKAIVGAEAALVGTAAWMITHSRHDLHAGVFAYRDLPMSLFGTGIVHTRPLAEALALIAIAVVAVSVGALARRRATGPGAWLVFAGVALIVLGTLAFARDPISPLDLGDRVNQVAAIGAELVWVGGILQMRRWRWAPAAAVSVLVVLGISGYVARDFDYRNAGIDTGRTLAAVLSRYPSPPNHVIVVGPAYLSHHGITGMLGPEDQAFDAVTGVNGWRVWVALSPSEFVSLPPTDRVAIRA